MNGVVEAQRVLSDATEVGSSMRLTLAITCLQRDETKGSRWE
jgi:hypothetical protein